jgi:DeoR/GlpR family transcriptional regulator of sugar metabolism
MIRADDAVRRVNSHCSQAKQSMVKSLKFCWCLVASGKVGCVGIFIVRSVNEFSEEF